MKHQKSWILCLLLAAALLAGCTGGGQSSPPEATAPTAEHAVTPTAAPLDPELPAGELTENNHTYNYVNQKLGFGCRLNEDWFMVQQQDPRPSAARGRVSFTDLSAQRMDACAGLGILVEDVTLPGGGTESPERYRDLSLPAVQQQLEEFGCTNIHVEANTFLFVGQEYPGIRFTCTTPVQDWYCQQIVIGSGHYNVTVSLSSYDADFLDELAALFCPLEGEAAPEGSDASQPPVGTLEDGFYLHEGLGLRFSLESWELLDRETVYASLLGDASLAALSPEELYARHLPDYELSLQRGGGDVRLNLILEKPPIYASDGVAADSPAAYMDNNVRSIPASYEQMGVTGCVTERFQRELCGWSFECCRVDLPSLGLYQTMLCTEQDGVFFTIFVTCIGADETEEILACFQPLE